ncbi:hypothetical protein ACI3RH_13860, partial [Lactococcus lactis]
TEVDACAGGISRYRITSTIYQEMTCKFIYLLSFYTYIITLKSSVGNNNAHKFLINLGNLLKPIH